MYTASVVSGEIDVRNIGETSRKEKVYETLRLFHVTIFVQQFIRVI